MCEHVKSYIEFNPQLALVTDTYNNSTLIHAVRSNDAELISYLLDLNKVDINHQNNGGDTAAIIASRFRC